MLEHYVAIDNVCAWPNLTQLRDGTIIATIFNQPCHGLWEGDVECWASVDGGANWLYRGTPSPHEPGTNRMNVAAGLAKNGDLLVMASGWPNIPVKGEQKAAGVESQPLYPWLSRSSDGGRTWAIDRETLRHTTLPGCTPFIPYGDIQADADGSLTAALYCRQMTGDAAGDNGVYLIRSMDDGRTWTAPIALAPKGHNETAILPVGNGHWIAVSRTSRIPTETHGMDLYRSSDAGQTWAWQSIITMERQIPAHLMRLADGRILLTYSSRCLGMFGLHARISRDDGRTWSRPVAILHYEDRDSGYPSTVQRKDGALVTAYYHQDRPHHQRYHMAVMIWRLDDFFPYS
jgi:hypothetical protein